MKQAKQAETPWWMRRRSVATASGSSQVAFPVGEWIGHGVGEPAVLDKPAREAQPLLFKSRLRKLTAQVMQLQRDEALGLARAEA